MTNVQYKITAVSFAIFCDAAIGASQWMDAPVTRALPGETVAAKTSFDTSFEKRAGTYRAMYDSITDTRDSAKGDFLVGRFRYAYAKPIEPEGGLPRYDESITEVLLGCATHMSGTLKITYKFKGTTVREVISTPSEVLLIQSSEPSTSADLCAFATRRGATK